jgi:hypothetical protein
MIYNCIYIVVVAAWTCFLKGCSLPNDNAHLEFHSRLHRLCKLRRIYHLVIFSAYDFVVTLFDDVTSQAIPAMTLDNVVEILVCGDEEVNQHKTEYRVPSRWNKTCLELA